MGATLFDKIWSRHRLTENAGGKSLIYFDRVVVDDVRAPQVLKNLERRALAIRRPELAVVVQDHSVPSFNTHSGLGGSEFVDATRAAARRHGLRLLDVGDAEQGISHVVMPELGLVLPGSTYLCVDSHSPTVGGVGALGLACGSSELEHVLATQAMWVRKPRQMRVRLEGRLDDGVCAKDVILHLIGRLGVDVARGVALEFAGGLVASLPVEARLTLCNMAVELGARTAIVAPDETTFAWLAASRMRRGPSFGARRAAHGRICSPTVTLRSTSISQSIAPIWRRRSPGGRPRRRLRRSPAMCRIRRRRRGSTKRSGSARWAIWI